MDKNTFLDLVAKQARAKTVTKKEIINAYDAAIESTKDYKSTLASLTFAYVGGAIMFLALIIFVGQNWGLLNGVARILLTLGVGLAAFTSGVLLDRHEKARVAAPALHLIAALLLPSGIAITLYTAGVDITSFGAQLTVFLSLFLAYLAAFLAYKKTLFLLFSIIFGTICYYVVGFHLPGGAFVATWQYSFYLTLAAGLAFCFMGYSLRQLRGPLYGFGLLGVLGALFALMGWGQDKIIIYEIIYPALLALVLWLSVKLKSSTFLVFGSLFLVGYIFKITAEYFTNTFGWPIVLAIIGLALVGVSVLAVNLKSRIAQK